MKRIAFAHVAVLYDFDSELEAMDFQRESRAKGWFVNREVYKSSDNVWSLEVFKPYKRYNPGW